MTPKSNSSDGDSKEAMETSAAIVSLSVGEKRKAETINSEDSGESEGGTESEEGSESQEDIDEEFERITKWGYDSYENRKYDSADDEDEYSDKELEKQWRCYNRQVIESKGFFKSSDEFPMGRIGGIATVEDNAFEGSIGNYGTIRQFCTLMASMCVEKYNEEKKKYVKVEYILRVNYRPGGWTKYYITFAAKESESSNAPLVEYQAKSVWCDDVIYPIFCRPSPPPPAKEPKLPSGDASQAVELNGKVTVKLMKG